MKSLTILFLMVSLYSSGQTKKQVRNAVTSASAIPVILECARKDVISARFFVPAVKIGDKFYYGNRKSRPLPKTWFVWDWKPINQEVARS